MPTSNKTIAKNTAFLYVRMLVVMVVTLYTSRIILQALGAEDYGIYDVVGGVVTIVAFLNSALSASTSRFLTYELGVGDENKLKKTFAASLNLHICAAIIVLVIGETVGLWFFYEKLVIPESRITAAFWVYQFSIITTMINFIQVPYNASIIAHEDMAIYAYIGLYDALSRLGIVYLLFVSPIDKLVFYALLLMINKCAIQFFYGLFTTKKYTECHFRLVKDKELYRKLLNYSGWDLFGGLAMVCQGQGISILLNMFLGPIVNAARAITAQVQSGVQMFVSNFLVAVRPQVVKSYAEGSVKRMFNLTFSSAKYAYLLMLAIVLPLCLEVNFVLTIWLGEKAAPDETALFVILTLVTCLMDTFHSAALMPYHAIGKIKLGNIVGGTMMIMALPLSYIALKMGAPAFSVYIAIFLVNFTQMFWGWIIVHRYESFSYMELIRRVYLPTIVVSIIVFIPPYLIRLIMEEGWIRFITLTFITEIVLLASTYFVAMNKEEKNALRIYIRKKFNRL